MIPETWIYDEVLGRCPCGGRRERDPYLIGLHVRRCPSCSPVAAALAFGIWVQTADPRPWGLPRPQDPRP